MKKFLLAVFTIGFTTSMIIAPATQVAAISEDQAGLISMTCGSIQLQLKNLQKADSRWRVSLGARYEFVLGSLITNLNLRLIKNNLATDDLASLQTTFSSERDFFKFAFTDYSKSLDELIATDCKSNPYDFYDKLETTRDKREAVRASYLRLNDVLEWHRTAVVELKAGLL